MKSKIGTVIALSLAIAISLVACVNDNALEDVAWVLESYGEPDNLKAVLEDTEITVAFDSAEAKIKGFAGCNSYGCIYEIRENKLFIFGPIAKTTRSCGGPIDTQEFLFLKALEAAESYKLEDGKLIITCGDKVLIFKRK